MLRNSVRPYRMARVIERKLPSKMTMSLASRATSVPLPMAKPTSASLSAGASLTPSPVMPVTRPFFCASRTSRLLSSGRDRATTRRSFMRARTSSSVMLRSCSPVNTPSADAPKMPHRRAMAAAVSRLSPVIMTTWTPAPSASWTARAASGRGSSLMSTAATKVMPCGRRSGVGISPPWARQMTRIPSDAAADTAACTATDEKGRCCPVPGSSIDRQQGISLSGAPLTSTVPLCRRTAEYL